MWITNDLMLYLAVLAAGLIALVYARLVIVPGLRRKKALKKIDEITQRKAMARLKEIQTFEGKANDPWSQTGNHDTIARELTKSQRTSLEKIGQNY